MTEQQKSFMISLTKALSSRKPSDEQIALIEAARIKLPKTVVRCEKMALEVRRRVDEIWFSTYAPVTKNKAKVS